MYYDSCFSVKSIEIEHPFCTLKTSSSKLWKGKYLSFFTLHSDFLGTDMSVTSPRGPAVWWLVIWHHRFYKAPAFTAGIDCLLLAALWAIYCHPGGREGHCWCIPECPAMNRVESCESNGSTDANASHWSDWIDSARRVSREKELYIFAKATQVKTSIQMWQYSGCNNFPGVCSSTDVYSHRLLSFMSF